MSDLISREEAIDAVNELIYPSDLMDVKRVLANLPSAGQKHGKWVYHYRLKKFVCLECGYEQKHKPEWKYCPECGARMDK